MNLLLYSDILYKTQKILGIFSGIFVIVFLESGIFFPLPGDSLLFTTGFLASQGYFHIVPLLAVLFVGSFLGYVFSYFMGKRIRDFILRSNDKYWFKKKHLDYTEKFFQKYGDKTIIIGRFVPIVRSFAPTLAGAVEMDYKRFTRDSFIGAFLWTFGMTLAGYYLGRIIPGADRYLTLIIMVIIAISLSPAIIEYIKHKRQLSD